MQHRYDMGQIVELIPAPRLSNRPAGPCRVLNCLPYEGQRLQYRIQSLAEGNQRVVSEEDLRPSLEKGDREPQSLAAPMTIAIARR